MTNELALSGLRVLECCGWNGVLAGRLLADSGADVVRVVPDRGDLLDREGPFTAAGTSLQAAWYNAGKRLVQLDWDSDAETWANLLAGADVLIEDWGAAGTPAGLDLADLNPGLVRVSVTPFGLEGPWSGYQTADIVANALSGAASVTGTPETPPMNGYGNQTHNTAGMYAAICAMAGWYARQATGEGQFIDLSAHESLIGCTEQLLMQWWFPQGAWGTPIAARQGSLHWSKAYSVYPTRTGHGEMISAALRFPDVLLPWLVESGAAQDLADKEKYPNYIAMVRDLPNVMRILREWVATWDADELFFEAQKRHQPFGPLWDIPQAAASPQLAAREYFQEVESPAGETLTFPGRFFRTDVDGPHPRPGAKATAAMIDWPAREQRAPATSSERSLPLRGVRILDFTHVLAGPFGTRVLGDLGADIIKVGTATRGAGANSTAHPYYCMWNRNKRSINLNMSIPEGRELARRLAAKCDVVMENFSAGVLRRWGLDRASMAETNPGLTVISMGGMGQTGPWKDFVTFAPTIHAITGLTYLTNPPGEHRLGYGFSLTDHLSGLAGAYAALAAIEHMRRTGRGLDIDLSQYELGMSLMGPAFLDYFANGTTPEPAGNRHPFGSFAPHGIYPCEGADRWVAIAVQGDVAFSALAGAMGQPSLAGDSRFATQASRLEHEDELDGVVGSWTAELDRYEVMRRCQAAGVPAGAVQNADDLANSDPQNAASGFFGTMATGPWGEHGVDRFPARINGQRPPRYAGAAEPGADTFDVLTEVLGLDGEEIAALAEAGALS